MSKKDLYAILGVPRDVGPHALRDAFQELALRHHPDREGGETGAFQEIAEAYQVLSEPGARARYDRARPPARPAPRCVPEPLVDRPRRGSHCPGPRPTIVVDPETAMWGGTVSVVLPAVSRCPWCHGGFADPFCACRGSGRIRLELPVRLRLPPLTRDGTIFPLEIPGLGVIRVEIQVR